MLNNNTLEEGMVPFFWAVHMLLQCPEAGGDSFKKYVIIKFPEVI